MERKEAMFKTGCSKLFWVVLAVFLCATTTFGYLTVTGEEDISANNPDIYDGLLAMPGSIVNIYSGEIGDGATTGITVLTGADVTVHGMDFADSLGPISADQWDPTGSGGNVLTVTYTDENGDPIGDPVNLLFYSDIAINLVDTAGGEEPEDPSTLIQALIDKVASFNLHQGIDNSLDAKLDAALNALDDVNENNDVAAINTLQALINAVEAQRDNKITDAQATELIADAQAIIDLLST